jgi:virginiamycin B lyase
MAGHIAKSVARHARPRFTLVVGLFALLGCPAGAEAGAWMETFDGSSNSPTAPGSIAAGSDGAMWYADGDRPIIIRMTTAGAITNEYPLPGHAASSLALGPDNALWFVVKTDRKIGRIDTTGHVDVWGPLEAGRTPSAITAGPDGALWFPEASNNKVGRITTAGAITNEISTNSGPTSIAAGPDNALWFTEKSGKIGRITADGSLAYTETDQVDGAVNTTSFGNIVKGSDGALWFGNADQLTIGRIRATAEPYHDAAARKPWRQLARRVVLARAAALLLRVAV